VGKTAVSAPRPHSPVSPAPAEHSVTEHTIWICWGDGWVGTGCCEQSVL